MTKIISETPINGWELKKYLNYTPCCEWREAGLRCVSVATVRIITDEDSKELCQHHAKEYKERYIH